MQGAMTNLWWKCFKTSKMACWHVWSVRVRVWPSLHCQHLNMEAAQFGLSDCRLPFACFHRKKRASEVHLVMKNTTTEGSHCTCPPFIIFLTSEILIQTVSPKKSSCSWWWWWLERPDSVDENTSKMEGAIPCHRTKSHGPTSAFYNWGILPDLQKNGHWWTVWVTFTTPTNTWHE